MSASTIQHLSSQDPAGSSDRRATSGLWEIGRGQRLGLAAGGLRKRSVSARILYGTLTLTDDLLGSLLEFTMLVPDADCRVTCSTRVVRLLSDDTWQADGTMTTASGSRQVSLRARDNGLFCQRGRQPSLWLTIQATIDVPELGAAVGRRRAGRLAVAAELNLNPRAIES